MNTGFRENEKVVYQMRESNGSSDSQIDFDDGLWNFGWRIQESSKIFLGLLLEDAGTF